MAIVPEPLASSAHTAAVTSQPGGSLLPSGGWNGAAAEVSGVEIRGPSRMGGLPEVGTVTVVEVTAVDPGGALLVGVVPLPPSVVVVAGAAPPTAFDRSMRP